MPSIPTITNELSARVGRSTQGIPSPQASPEAFGAAMGRGLQAVGQGVDRMAQGAYTLQEKRRLEDVANRVAQSDFTSRELALRNEAPPDGAGYQERVLEEYDIWLDEQAGQIEDDETRQEFTQRMQSARPGLSSRAAQYEFGTAAQYGEQQTNQSLIALDNRIRLQPDRYDELIAQGVDVINSQVDLPATARVAMVDAFRMNSAAARFDGMLESVQTVADVDALEAQLRGEAGREWGAEMSQDDLGRLTSTMGTVRTAIRTQADAQARAAIDSLEERATDVTVLLPREELRAAQQLAAASENLVTVARMARIVRDQELVSRYRTATPEQMRAGQAGMLETGSGIPLPQRQTLDTAGRGFGVGLEYMTRVAGDGGAQGVVDAGAGWTTLRLPDGSAVRREGTRAWRNNNPGNIEYGDFARRNGAVGTDGRFAVFPSYEAGRDAKAALIFESGSYRDLSIASAIARYAPSFENDTDAYVAQVASAAGVSSDTVMSSLSPEQRVAVLDAMERVEGFREGTESETQAAGASNARISQEFIDRALATPGVRETLAGDESPERIVAAYAAHSRAFLQQTFGREPSDDEIYMAHIEGAEGAADIIEGYAAGDPTAAARYRELTVQYAEAGPQGGISASAYANQETLGRIADDAEGRIEDDPMTYAAQVGVLTMTGLGEENGWGVRGDEARRVADYYRIPASEMQPFTNQEADALGNAMTEGTADDVLEIITQVQALGGDIARAGLRQISELDDVYGYAGGLQMETGNGAVASDIVRGQKRLEENPEIARLVGANDFDMSTAFNNATGAALFDLAPSQRQSIMDAATAHYVETHVARGGAGAFDTDAFTRSINAVLGGQNGQPAIDEVNGTPTILPPGLTGDMMETALGSMSLQDWASMSEQRLPPRYADGAIADPRDLQDEATLRPIGAGKYRVALDDGSVLVTGRPGQNGRMEAFIFVPDPARVNSVIQTAQQRAEVGNGGRQTYDTVSPEQSPVVTPEELQSIFNQYPDLNLGEGDMNELRNYLNGFDPQPEAMTGPQ